MIAFEILGGVIVASVAVLVIIVTVGCAIALLGGYNNEINDKEEEQWKK